MNNYGIAEKSYLLLQEYFTNHKNILKVMIFGSRATNQYRNGSDIDLAIWGIDIDDIKIKMDLENLQTPYMYDVINYDKLEKEELKKHIDTKGQLFYEKA